MSKIDKLKDELKNRRQIRWLEEVYTKRAIPTGIKKIYTYMLKYNKNKDTEYRLSCYESSLTPGHYVVEIWEQFPHLTKSDGQLEMREFRRDSITLKPVGEENTRF